MSVVFRYRAVSSSWGCRRKRGNESFGDEFDGVDLKAMPLPRLQQMIEASAVPAFKGLD